MPFIACSSKILVFMVSSFLFNDFLFNVLKMYLAKLKWVVFFLLHTLFYEDDSCNMYLQGVSQWEKSFYSDKPTTLWHRIIKLLKNSCLVLTKECSYPIFIWAFKILNLNSKNSLLYISRPFWGKKPNIQTLYFLWDCAKIIYKNRSQDNKPWRGLFLPMFKQDL